MDVRRKETPRGGVASRYPRSRRPGLAWLGALLAVALVAIVALGATSARADDKTEWVADPSTADQFTSILGTSNPINGRYAGRVWTDKSVVADKAKGIFNTTFSALGSSRVINSELQNPPDVVFIVDVSGSMQGDRMTAATGALNSAVSSLMQANEHNRVAVTTFSTSSGAAPFVALDHYDGIQFTYGSNQLSVSGGGASGEVNVTGGTNTQLGIYRGMQVLASRNDSMADINGNKLQRIPAVVLLSDGAPTYSQNTSDWWNPAARGVSQAGNGQTSYYGNGMLAMMEAGYQKGEINRAYGVDATSRFATKVYTIQVGDNGNLANVTLDPEQYLSANNTMSNNIREQWENYSNNRTAQVQAGRQQYITLNHPTSNDITSLVYTDEAYKVGKDDLTTIFTSIIQQLQNTAFTPVTDSFGDSASPLTYSDPIGQYMKVASVDSVELFGQAYKVTENNGTYSVVSNGAIEHPVSHKQIDPANIRIEVQTNEANGTQTLTCQVPADILPVRLETIKTNASGEQTDFTSNRGEPAAQPLRLNYKVGFSDAVKTNGSVDLSKVSAKYKDEHRNAAGGIDFYSNTYSKKTESEPVKDPNNPGTVGDATATFAPSEENRFYYFQANRTIYAGGTEGVLGAGGSVEESSTLGSVDQLVDNSTYYLVIDYHQQGAMQRVDEVVARTGAELKGSVEVKDGKLVTREGAPRLGNTNRFTQDKETNNTGTASLAYSPAYVYSSGEGSDYQVVVSLGNNGRVTVPETAVRIQKVVTAADDITAPDQDFTFTVNVNGHADGSDELAVYEQTNDGWQQAVDASGDSVTQTVTWANGSAEVTLKAGQSVLVEVAPGATWTVTEDDIANTDFSLAERSGSENVSLDGDRGIRGTSDEGTTQSAVFTNRYAPTTTWTTAGTDNSILVTKTLTGDLASGQPRGFRVGDHFSFEITTATNDAGETAPLPSADKADGSGAFDVTSVEVGVSAVNSDGTLNLTYVYRGANGEVSAEQTVSSSQGFSAAFPAVTYDAPGTYTYTVRESRAAATNVVAGVSYDAAIYRFTVPVAVDASDPTKLAVGTVGVSKRLPDGDFQDVADAAAPIVFENTYDTTEVRRSFGVTKVLEGAQLKADQFDFTLTGVGSHAMSDADVTNLGGAPMTRDQAKAYAYDENVTPPMPDGATGKTATATNGAGGNVTFGGIAYEQASASVAQNPTADDFRRGVVYHYTVAENEPASAVDHRLNGITYDQNKHDVYVYVYVASDPAEGEMVRSLVIYGDDHSATGKANQVPFVNTYEATGSAEIKAEKTITGRTFRDGDTFAFDLYERANGVDTWMQTRSITVGQSQTDYAGQSSFPVEFDSGDFEYALDDVGTHTYVLREVAPAASDRLPGMTYDTSERVVTVTVSDNGDGTLNAQVNYPNAADKVTWTNAYAAPSAEVSLGGTKTFNAGPIASQAFGFSTWATDDTYNTDGVAPYSTWVGEGKTVTNSDGSVTSTAPIPNLLPGNSYAPGDYYFVIAENPGGSAGVDYDATRYRVHLTVEDNFNGTATPFMEVSSSTDGGQTWSDWAAPAQGSLTFTNTFNGVEQGVAQLSKVTLNATVPTNGYEFSLRIQRQSDDGSWVDAKATEAKVEGATPNDGTYTLRSTADGSIPMGSLVFLREGTYRTLLTEVVPQDALKLDNNTAVADGMAYDTRTASASYQVTRNGTSLNVARTGADTLAFINDGGIEVSKAVYADGVTDANTLPQGPFTFKVSGLGEDQTVYLVADGKVTALTNDDTFELSGGKSGRIYGLGQGGTVKLTESTIDGFTPDDHELTATVQTGSAANKLAFKNKYTPGSASQRFSVAKELTGREWADGETFSFTLTGENGAPMPDAGGETATVSKNGSQASFGAISFDKAGTYTYTVREQVGSAGGVTYDTSVYTVTVEVAYDQASGAMKSTATYVKDGKPAELADGAMAFTNTYASTGSLTPEAAAKLDVTKTLNGREMADDQFSFTVKPADEASTDKLGETTLHSVAAKAGESSKAVDDAGKTLGALLGSVTFTQADAGKTFSWTVAENGTDSPAAGYTMDTTVYTVSISVTDNGDGTLTATPAITKGAGDAADAVAFVNGYGVTELMVPVTDQVKVTKVLTGRPLAEGEFSFELVDDSGATVATGKNAANGTVTMGPALTFSAPGEYAYKLREVKGDLGGVTYDETVHDIVLTVADKGDGTLSVSRKQGTPEAVAFHNVYRSTGSMEHVASVNVAKRLTGRPQAAGQFTFAVTPADDASAAKLATQTLQGQKAQSGETVAVVTKDGKALSELFSTVTFDQNDAGKTFAWTISENGADAPAAGYKMDASVHRVEVKVTDNGNGTISAATSVDGKPVENNHATVAFSNSYAAESNPEAAQGSGRVVATKTLLNRDLVDGEFTFVMRDAKGNKVAEAKNKADGTVDFGAQKYSTDKALADVAAGIAVRSGTDERPVYRYEYTLSEVTDNLPGNVTASVGAVTVTVNVADNGDGTMTCDVVWPSDGTGVGFVNAYEADPLSVTFSGSKFFTAPAGLSVPDSVVGAFTFTLADESGKVLGTATNDASGNVAFPAITYTQADLNGAAERTFTYTVTESGSVPGVANDGSTSRTITVHLTQGADGHLAPAVEGAPFSFTNTYGVDKITTSVTDQVKVSKVLSGRAMAAGEFTFQLVDAVTGEVAATGTNAADGTVTMDPVTYDRPGTYTYELVEVAGEAPGVTYDDAVHTVTTTVTDNGDGTLSAKHSVAGGEAVFENAFTPTPVVDPAFGVGAKKVLVGRDWTDGDAFTFVTVAETEGAPMPDPAAVTATRESPMGTFGNIVFDRPGTYSYLVSETAGDEEHMTYSQAVYRVIYVVTKDDATGELSMDTSVVRIKGDDGAEVSEECPADAPMEFVNTYAKPDEPVVPDDPAGPDEPAKPEQPAGPSEPAEKRPQPVLLPVTGLLAKTGDVVAPLLPWIGTGAALVTAGVVRILRGGKGGKRRRD